MNDFFTDDVDVNALSFEGKTALFLACRNGDDYTRIVRLLLSAGADPMENGGHMWVLPLQKGNCS